MSFPNLRLPEAEPLPADLIHSGDERQFGIRWVDRPLAGGRLTAGIWHSGVFETKFFEFGGFEWIKVLEGTIVFETSGGRKTILAGTASKAVRGTSMRWCQPDPVLKLFLRWDGDGAPPDLDRLWNEVRPQW